MADANRAKAIVVVLMVTVLSAACGTTADSRAAEADGGAVGAQPLDFSAATTEGRPFDGSTLAGKDVVLWFWAAWCTECRREAPSVSAVQAATGDQVSFVGIAGLGEVDEMRMFVDDYHVDAFPHLVDVDGALWERFGVTRQPAYAFVDDSGDVRVVRGELAKAGLADEVNALIAN